MRPEDEAEIIARATASPGRGETLVIGEGGQLPPADGFTVSRLRLAKGEVSPSARSGQPEVVFVQGGTVEVIADEATIPLGPGDTMTVPTGLDRAYRGSGDGAELIVVRGTG
jgi:quercetin dioxygenase-like cupin family protein